jgi:hypothetical protein
MMLCFPLALQRVSLRLDKPLHPAPAVGAALGAAYGKSQLETFSIVDSTYGLRIIPAGETWPWQGAVALNAYLQSAVVMRH